MEEPTGAVTSEDLHKTYLNRSKKELQKKIEQLRCALAEENERLAVISQKHGHRNSNGTVHAKKQLDAVAEAYRDVAASEPFLPFPDSVVPALVALRITNSSITESKRFLDSQKISLQDAQDSLETEKANLADQKALTKALENRVLSLRDGIGSRTAMSPGQVGRERISELKKQIKETDADTSRLLKALKNFIHEPLAAMLAAEQGGGPVAGDIIDIDSDDLEAGFNARGKRKKSKEDAASDKRQRRIDDMFGRQQEDRDGGDDVQPDKRAAAREEMQGLTEELMNKLMDSGGSSSDAYIDIPEESAAVRFLIRSKVAEFHPKDSKRLRLVDFGREIGD